MPRYEKEESTVQEQPSELEAFASGGMGLPKKKKGKKGKQSNRYSGLM